jgi:hypothetical protein
MTVLKNINVNGKYSVILIFFFFGKNKNLI